MIAIIDTGGANHASIQNALLRLGSDSIVTVDAEDIEAASHIILPGVGHAQYAMDRIGRAKIGQLLKEQTQPVLGICLGMQILFAKCEEGPADGLGIFPGTVRKLVPHGEFRVPHMGWNQIESRTGRPSRLLQEISPQSYFYFVHSYGVPDCEWISHATREVGSAPGIPAVLESKNIFATQFHPERSGPAGAQLLKNFLSLTGVDV